MRFSDLQALLAEQGQFLALDPAAAPEATIGGLIATNASGPLRFALRHGARPGHRHASSQSGRHAHARRRPRGEERRRLRPEQAVRGLARDAGGDRRVELQAGAHSAGARHRRRSVRVERLRARRDRGDPALAALAAGHRAARAAHTRVPRRRLPAGGRAPGARPGPAHRRARWPDTRCR